ncbi:MAG: FtsX-like permease family protein [Bryobacteraceae bacterium]|nr:FtsX-like permease family protein [Bryobacteraceae bacterium]
MSPLNTKLFRDLIHLRGQVIAVALVVMCGVATYITMFSAYHALVATQAEYYQHYRFADLFAAAKRAPESIAARIREIPGVAAVETRVVVDALLDVPGLDEPATGRLISIPPGPRPMLNDIFIRRGRYVEPGRRGEVLASEAFASANKLNPGDEIGAVINGHWERLRITGIALSPEYVYEIRGTEVLPDNRRFGVLWMSRDVLGPAYDMEGGFNDLSVALAPGANPNAVAAGLDHILEPYGGRGAYDREEQVSHRFLSDEISQDRVTGTFIPAIFLGVAALLIHIVLSRLVSTQRAEIGVLKAFGYTHAAIGWSYIKFAMMTVAPGAGAGILLGAWLGRGLANLYAEFFRFPVLHFRVGWELAASAVLISCGSAVIGAWLASNGAASLPPAEAMRPPSPPRFHAGLLERFGFALYFPVPVRMILRNINRRKGKSALTVIGIAFSLAILILGRFFVDTIDYILDVQFTHAMRQDVSLWLNNPSSPSAGFDIGRLPAVLQMEPFRLVAVRLKHEHRKRRLAIFGLPAGAQLNRVLDRNLQVITLPEQGLVISRKLAEIMAVRPGDRLTVEVIEGQRPTWQAPVAATVDDMIGLFAYMDMHALNRLMREDGVISGAYLAADPAGLPELYRHLKTTPSIAGALLLEAMKKSFLETIAENMMTSTMILVSFACVIAFGVVYNSARIALSERGHELASLRVLGFTHGEVSRLLLGEQAILTFAAVPVGYAIGYAMAAMLISAMATELYRMPLIVSARTYAFAFLIVLAAACLSALLIIVRLHKLDLIGVLKTRE